MGRAEGRNRQLAVALESARAHTKIEQAKLAVEQRRLAVAQKGLAEAERKRAETLEQVRRRQQPRVLTTWQTDRLIAVLKQGGRGKVTVASVHGDGEAEMLAVQIRDVLVRAGWETAGIEFQMSVICSGAGILIDSAKTAPPYAGRLQQAFCAAGFPLPCMENPALAAGTVKILVGHKPWEFDAQAKPAAKSRKEGR